MPASRSQQVLAPRRRRTIPATALKDSKALQRSRCLALEPNRNSSRSILRNSNDHRAMELNRRRSRLPDTQLRSRRNKFQAMVLKGRSRRPAMELNCRRSKFPATVLSRPSQATELSRRNSSLWGVIQTHPNRFHPIISNRSPNRFSHSLSRSLSYCRLVQ
jgi:hypothetical protein